MVVVEDLVDGDPDSDFGICDKGVSIGVEFFGFVMACVGLSVVKCTLDERGPRTDDHCVFREFFVEAFGRCAFDVEVKPIYRYCKGEEEEYCTKEL